MEQPPVVDQPPALEHPSAPGQPVANAALPPEADDEITGLPALPTWASVYWFVLGVFILYVVLLSLLSRTFV